MTISNQTVARAITALGSLSHVEMDPTALVEDALLLAADLPSEDEYLAAIANTIRALEQLISDTVDTSALKYDFAGWSSFHYQHRVTQGAKADMRIIFKQNHEKLRVIEFGLRNRPADVYTRLAATRF